MEKQLIWFEDPGHAWLAVPMDELFNLGIADKISTYSYKRGDIAYLEEDCDAGIYIDALKKLHPGITFKNKETFEENTPIRNYVRF